MKPHSNINLHTIDLASMFVRRYFIEDMLFLENDYLILLSVAKDYDDFNFRDSVRDSQGLNIP